MLKEIPKATTNHKRQDLENQSEVIFLNQKQEPEKPKPKAEVIEELGFNRQQVSQFQQMAEHEDFKNDIGVEFEIQQEIPKNVIFG